jgi:altronate dehydratase
MGKLVDLKTSSDDKTLFFIESTEVEGSSKVQQATGYTEKEFDKLLKRVKPFCEAIIDNFQTLSTQPNSASAEFGLNVTAEGNIFIVKASGQATLKITLNWNNLK